MTDRERIIAAAKEKVGYKEDPPNSNKNMFGEWFGFNGVAWCAIFVSWCYDKAGLTLKNIEAKYKDKGFAWCPSMYFHAKRFDKITMKPQAGDIVLFDWDGNKQADHVGIFYQWIKEGEIFVSYEGNTSPSNNSNGGEVMLRTRKVSQVQAFVNMLG